jgi:hypothetical protein
VFSNFYSEKSADLNIFIRDSNAKESWGLGKTSRLQPRNALGQLMYKKKIGSKAWAEEKVMGENPDPEHKK